MNFGLLLPENGDYNKLQAKHHWDEMTSTILTDHAFVYVLDPRDDENYMHGAKFEKGKVTT